MAGDVGGADCLGNFAKGDKMTNREWLNSLSDEDFCTALEQVDCRLCAFYGDCKGKQCRDGFVEWLREEHKEDGKEG
jgi:hypothetical protein